MQISSEFCKSTQNDAKSIIVRQIFTDFCLDFAKFRRISRCGSKSCEKAEYSARNSDFVSKKAEYSAEGLLGFFFSLEYQSNTRSCPALLEQHLGQTANAGPHDGDSLHVV